MSWINPDIIYSRRVMFGVELYSDVVAFIYDVLTDTLYAGKDDVMHVDLISKDHMDFLDALEGAGHPVPDKKAIGSSITALGNLRVSLQTDMPERFVFGRSGYFIEDSTYIFSFWEDYSDYLVSKSNKKVADFGSYKSGVKRLVSRPSGTVVWGGGDSAGFVPRARSSGGDIERKKALELHLMSAAEKREALLGMGVRGRTNQWAAELKRLGLSGQEPWRLYSESDQDL